jgi:DUF971 family protein
MPTEAVPVNLAIRPPDKLWISWSDGMEREYRFVDLRKECPCATCKEKRMNPAPANRLMVLAPQEAQPVKIASMSPLGNYAYAITFNDGHDTGIYTLEFLRELGTEVAK